jgi:hypothetical protein
MKEIDLAALKQRRLKGRIPCGQSRIEHDGKPAKMKALANSGARPLRHFGFSHLPSGALTHLSSGALTRPDSAGSICETKKLWGHQVLPRD